MEVTETPDQILHFTHKCHLHRASEEKCEDGSFASSSAQMGGGRATTARSRSPGSKGGNFLAKLRLGADTHTKVFIPPGKVCTFCAHIGAGDALQNCNGK